MKKRDREEARELLCDGNSDYLLYRMWLSLSLEGQVLADFNSKPQIYIYIFLCDGNIVDMPKTMTLESLAERLMNTVRLRELSDIIADEEQTCQRIVRPRLNTASANASNHRQTFPNQQKHSPFPASCLGPVYTLLFLVHLQH